MEFVSNLREMKMMPLFLPIASKSGAFHIATNVFQSRSRGHDKATCL